MNAKLTDGNIREYPKAHQKRSQAEHAPGLKLVQEIVIPIFLSSSGARALLCHLLFLAPVSTIFNFYFILVKLTSAHRQDYLLHLMDTGLTGDTLFLHISRLSGKLFLQVSLSAANSLTCCRLLELCLSSHAPFFLWSTHHFITKHFKNA